MNSFRYIFRNNRVKIILTLNNVNNKIGIKNGYFNMFLIVKLRDGVRIK